MRDNFVTPTECVEVSVNSSFPDGSYFNLTSDMFLLYRFITINSF